MKLVIFAGGHGTRLWPLSRKNSPKQFEKMFNGQSTLQMTVERISGEYDHKDIYISTNEKFAKIIKQQVPEIPSENIIFEPERRDLAAAVGLAFMTIKNQGYSGPIAILWSDHLMDHVETFQNVLKIGEQLIIEDSERFVFIGEDPRFANENLGWIKIGSQLDRVNDIPMHAFEGWAYRPALDKCKEMYESGTALWNPGYFITSVDFVLGLYKQFHPQMHTDLGEMVKSKKKLKELYPKQPAMHFDTAIVEKTDPSQAVVLHAHLGWSDPGTLYALKEALETNRNESVSVGKVVTHNTEDSLIYNQNEHQLVAVSGLDGFIVVNTQDALLVCPKEEVRFIKDLLEKIELSGHEDKL